MGRWRIAANDFEGDSPVEFAVDGLIDNAHPAFSKYFQELIALAQNGASQHVQR